LALGFGVWRLGDFLQLPQLIFKVVDALLALFFLGGSRGVGVPFGFQFRFQFDLAL